MKPIYLRLSKPFGELAVEASRFWGSPALPKGMDYPQYIDDAGDEYPYVFVCQINLAELKAFLRRRGQSASSDGAAPVFRKKSTTISASSPTPTALAVR